MEEYEVLGFQPVSYERKDGQKVNGTRLFLRVLEPKQGTVGMAVASEWLNKDVTYTPVIGDHVRLLYNRYGRVVDCESL